LLLAPLLLYAYLPLRSSIVAAQHLDPNAVAPLYGEGGIDWDLGHPRTTGAFLDVILGRHEGAGSAVGHSLNLSRAGRALALGLEHAREQFSDLFLVVAGAGFAALALRDLRSLSILVAGSAGGLMFANAYRGDVELYRYFLVAYAVTAALAAAATRLPLPRARPAIVSACAAVALFGLAVWAWHDDWGIAAETRYSGAQATIDAVRRDVPDRAIVVAAWYDATTLGYGSAVEHALGSRLIVRALPREYVDLYPSWTRSRRVFIYANPSTAPYVEMQIPRAWLHEVRSSQPHYRVFEVLPGRS
jgi:hypothetical protein